MNPKFKNFLIVFLLISLLCSFVAISNPNLLEGFLSNSQEIDIKVFKTQKEIEQESPLNYISSKYSYHTNFFGSKYVINGIVKSFASEAYYVNPRVRIDFNDANHNLISSENHSITGVLNPNGVLNFELRLKYPSGTEKIDLTVISVSN